MQTLAERTGIVLGVQWECRKETDYIIIILVSNCISGILDFSVTDWLSNLLS